MSSQPDTVREWLISLSVLIGVSGNRQDVIQRLGVYVPYLLKVVPIEAFTAASVEAVARTCKYMPSYAELCDKLEAWWAEQRPDKPPPRIAYEPPMYRVEIPPRRAEPTDAEMAYVGEIVGALRMDLAAQAVARELETPRLRKRTQAAVDDATLLAMYDAMGPAGVVRAEMLRRKLAEAGLLGAREAAPRRDRIASPRPVLAGAYPDRGADSTDGGDFSDGDEPPAYFVGADGDHDLIPE